MAGKAGGAPGRTRVALAICLVLAAIAVIAVTLAGRMFPSAPVTGAQAKPPALAAAQPTPQPVAAHDPHAAKRILKIDGPLKHGAYVWDDKGVPPGDLVITVDLAAQTLSVFRGGYEIGVAVILYGATDKPTPIGTYPILQKKAKHVSNLYGAPMPYMLRLTNDGVAIHASEVSWGSATHGCIGVPLAFAKLLFAQAKTGDRVIVTDGKMMDVSGAPTA